MKRALSSCLFLIYLAAPVRVMCDDAPSRDVHVWRGEYEHALFAPGGELDQAAYCMLAGEAHRALEVLCDDAERYRRGLLSYRAQRYSDAIGQLDEQQGNRYLESFRLMYRALALQSESRHTEAVIEFRKLVRLEAGSSALPLTARARDLLIEASFHSETPADSIVEFLDGMDAISGRSSLFLAAIFLEQGREHEARASFIRGIGSTPDSTSYELFGELLERFMSRLDAFAAGDIISMTEAAISMGKRLDAETMIEHLESVCPGDGRSALLRGYLLRSAGMPGEALECYRQLFRSQASVEIKKEALLEIASTEYRLRLHDKSAESYRMFGLYYPNDHRSDYALDVAARLFVSLEKPIEALRTWKSLRKHGFGSSIAREAALSEAVLRCELGSREEAYAVLKDLLAVGDEGLEPALLYWLQRAAPLESEQTAWMRRLVGEHPLSFYAIAAQGDHSIFSLKGESSLRADHLVERLERREREFVESVNATLRPDARLCDHAAYEALIYFLERGFIEEARVCAGELERIFGSDPAGMAALYATVRASGLVDLGLKLLWTKGLSKAGSPIDYSLRYPTAYSSLVSREAAQNDLPPELILAIIREESSFDRFAVSRAGALGLMQLMPATGAWIERMMRREDLEGGNLITPAHNIAAGSWYLRYLLGRCNDSVVAALAAYNGGETRLARWRKIFKPTEEPMVAIEMIGPRETRRYVKKVLDTMAVYRAIALSDPEL
jgi:tetratricopeptide (TPR) repeat protein